MFQTGNHFESMNTYLHIFTLIKQFSVFCEERWIILCQTSFERHANVRKFPPEMSTFPKTWCFLRSSLFPISIIWKSPVHSHWFISKTNYQPPFLSTSTFFQFGGQINAGEFIFVILQSNNLLDFLIQVSTTPSAKSLAQTIRNYFVT